MGNRLIKLSSTGTVVWAKGTAGQHGWVNYPLPASDFNSPNALAVDKAGNIYVTGSNWGGPNVRIYKPDGTLLKIFDEGWGEGDHQFYYPDGITVDNSGNIYIADGNAQIVKKYNKAGTKVGQFGQLNIYAPDNGHFNNPRGLTTDSSGNLYVADHNNCRVQKFSSKGIFLMTFGTTLCGNQIDRMGGPSAVAVDFAGQGLRDRRMEQPCAGLR